MNKDFQKNFYEEAYDSFLDIENLINNESSNILRAKLKFSFKRISRISGSIIAIIATSVISFYIGKFIESTDNNFIENKNNFEIISH